MKRLISLLFVTLLTISYSYSQNDGTYTFGTSGTESASSIIQLSDGTYIIGARTSGNDFTLLNVNNNGALIKQATLPNTMTITKLVLLANNDILVVGSETSTESASLVVIRLNSNLTIQWSKRLAGSFMAYAFSAIECQNGELMFVGYSSTSGSSNADWDGLAFRLFSNGNLRWKKIIQTSVVSDWLVDLVELPGGNVVAFGASSQSTVDYQIMKIAPNGDISGLKTFDAGQNEVMYHALLVNNKLYVTAGSWSFSFGQYDMSYIKLDTNFNIEISKVYGGSSMDFPLYSFYKNNEISVFGYTNTFDSDYDLVITTFDLSGNKLGTKRIGGANRELVSTKGNSFLINNNNKFVTVGETATHGSGSTDIFLSFAGFTTNCCPFISDVSYSIANATYASSNTASITANTSLNTLSNISITPNTTVLYTSASNCAITTINANIQADTVTCKNVALNFTSTSNAVSPTFSWDFGDPSAGLSNNSTLQNPTFTYANNGNYLVVLTVSNGCSLTKDSITIHVNNGTPLDVNPTTAKKTYCTTEAVNFNSNVSILNTTHLWNFGDPTSGLNNTATSMNASHTYANPGIYVVTYFVIQDCRTDSDTIHVYITDNIEMGLNIIPMNATYCANNIVNFISNNNSNTATYHWDFGDPSSGANNTSSSNSTSHNYTSAGNYVATIIVNDYCSVDSDTVHIYVVSSTALTSQLSIPTLSYCTGDSIRITGNSNDVDAVYNWEVIDNTNTVIKQIASKNAKFTLSNNGNYKIYLITNNACNSDTDSVFISITGGVNAIAQSNKLTYCVNEVVSLTGTITGVSSSFVWNFDDPSSGSNNTSSQLNPTHSYSIPGNYTITLIVTGGCLPDTSFLDITVSNGFNLNTQVSNIPRAYCPGDTVKLIANSDDPLANFSWNFGDPNSSSNNSSLTNPTHVYNTSGNYVITLNSNNNCFQEEDTIHISIGPFISPSFDFILDSCTGAILFTNTTLNTNSNTYSWLINGEEISTNTNASTVINNSGKYEVRLIVNPNSNCVDTLFQELDLSLFDDSSNLFIPNIFTPNNDGINDFFEITGSNLCKVSKLIVFNRWGRKIYETENELKWDGKNENEICPVGTYIIYLELENKKIVRAISLLR